MNHYKYYLTILLAVFMIFAGIMHFVKPRFYNRFIPDFIPKLFANYLAGIIEVLLGVGIYLSPSKLKESLRKFTSIYLVKIHI